MRHRLRRGAAAALAAAALALPALLAANMADPVEPGDRLGEPSPALAGLRVERETLTLDLRPVADGAPAAVHAVYRIRNATGRPVTLPLLFVADALEGGGEVTVDGAPLVADAVARDTSVPEPWRDPRRAPPGPRPWDASGPPGSLRFLLPLDTGAHTVAVRYRARPTAESAGELTKRWHLGYALAPARRWDGFGGLDARVLLPEGWDGAAAPAMERRGDTLAAAWDALPADHLAVRAQAPEPFALPWWLLLAAGAAVGLLLCVALGMRAGAALARRGRGVLWALLPGLLLGVAWATGVLLGVAAVQEVLREAVPAAQLARNTGYGAVFASLLAWPALALFAACAVLVAAHRAHGRVRGRGG